MELNEMEKRVLYQTEGSEWYDVLHELAEARQRSGAEQLKGDDIMALERFDPEAHHMVIFDVLS